MVQAVIAGDGFYKICPQCCGVLWSDNEKRKAEIAHARTVAHEAAVKARREVQEAKRMAREYAANPPSRKLFRQRQLQRMHQTTEPPPTTVTHEESEAQVPGQETEENSRIP